jgi:uncharacterized membrane protein YkoI
MMTNLKQLPLLVLLMLLPAYLDRAAGRAEAYDEQSLSTGRKPLLDEDAAAAAVRRATGGKVLRIDPSSQQGNPGYRVRVLLGDGRVRVFNVDASTGKLSD